MKPDGTDLRRLTWDLSSNGAPSWGFVPEPAGIEDERIDGPTLEFANPVRARARFRFATAREGRVTLEIYDCAGRRTRTLVRQRLAPGAHSATWDGRDDSGAGTPSGAYYCRLTADGARRTVRFVYLR